MALPELNAARLDHKRAAHLLRRATFGATREQINTFANLSPEDAVNELFRTPLPDPVLPIDPATGNEWFTGTTPPVSEDSDLVGYFLGWILGQMMSHGVPPELSLPFSAREKVVFFLHTHFTTIRSKVASSRALYIQNQLYRIFALDDVADPNINFKNLTVKVSVDNAMLRLLDGNLNVKGSVNENYARELLELYSIGRGLEGVVEPGSEPGDYFVYKEADVRTAARVLSGWDFDDTFSNIDPDTNLPRGIVKGSATNASSHDNDLKQFSERFNNQVITPDPLLQENGNPTEASALDEIRQLIDIIYSKTETAHNICRKIYRFYVWSPHTQEETIAIETAIISEMAATFIENNYRIQPVIENLLRSEHFYEAGAGFADDNFGGIIKSPIDLTIGAMRFFNVQLPDMISDAENFYELTGDLIAKLESMGMKFYEPYDVAGYEAYHQFPVYHRFWITPNALARRYEFLRSLVTLMETGRFKVNVLDYVTANFSNEASDERTLIVALGSYLFPVPDTLDFDKNTQSALTTQRMNYFRNVILNGLGDGYWTTIWNGSSITDKRLALENLFNAMLQSPEYQLA